MLKTRTRKRPGSGIRPSALLYTALYSFYALSMIFSFSSSARAQINCQSEIYLPAKTDPEDRFKKGYC
ncbi:MAG: hypothetical protein ACREN0_04975, partial [Thermodesulfobacteriota bacterium]